MILRDNLLIRSRMLHKSLNLSFPGVLLLGIDFKALSNYFPPSSISQKSFFSLVRQGRSIQLKMLERFVNDLPLRHLNASSKKVLISSFIFARSQISFPFTSSFLINVLTDRFFQD